MQQVAVNSHCLEHIMVLSEQRDIVASEDIVNERGIKLWAKGHKVSRSLQEKLLHHRLTQPLESALTVDGGILSDQIVTHCLEKIDENQLLQHLCGSTAARSVLGEFRKTPLPGPFKLLLTSAHDTGMSTYDHSLYCMAVCAGMAVRLRLDDHSAQLLLMAALVHDIGELYINPLYIRSSARLAPSEWKQVAVHPRIGQILVKGLTSLPASIHTAVAEHHERLDGSGYPAQHTAPALSKFGRILAVADTAGAIATSNQSGKTNRLAVALRIVPEEFDHAAAGAVIDALPGNISDDTDSSIEDAGLERILNIVARLENALQVSAALHVEAESRIAVETAAYVHATLRVLSKALSATGVAEAAQLEEILTDRAAIAEIRMVTYEVEWRLRNLARNIYLRVHLMHDGCDLPLVHPLVTALDATP